ncbi:wall-associated receptor kinase 2-like [Salvia miltiorrhiza]|uniref:wall-associated receptor kinase 2-like n=1 Tax=Salvia miltiorrhiza TaxID=226208 RepID=UPI0025ABBCB7|nr:wall-associated receptor kinase 2-like [Salvia miltiorrhiza]
MISACYDLSANDGNSLSLNLSGTPYTLSFGNVLTAIGCDDMVLRSNGSSVSGGCSAFCADKNGTGGVGNCPFHGCCQERLDKGTSVMGAQLIDLSGKSQREKLFPCSYAFMQELDETTIFSYPLYYLHNSTALVNDNWASATRRPVVRLDWIVGTENCSRARNSATYACGDDKSVCVDDDSNRGYMCNCVQGYEGNPYLHGGCQTISFSRSSIAKYGCLDQCGQVSIPYPFGVGPNCCLEPSFEILCNTSTNPPKAYLAIFNTEIVELNSTKVLVNYLNLASTCYNNENGISKAEERRLTLDLMRSQYRLSEENWITAVGCDDTAVAVIGQTNLASIRTACAAICSDSWIYEYDNAQCDYGTTSLGGEACCRVPIPRGTNYLEANLTDLSGRWPRTNFSCSYAFVEYIEKNTIYTSSFPLMNNSTGITPDVLFSRTKYPSTALDWRIGELNCKEAQLNPTNYVCQANTDCVDYDATLGGYLCNCSKGYQGNAYLHPGCQDIDECANNPCDAYSYCKNIAGSFECLCLRGYTGDGRLSGSGCTRLQSPNMIKIALIGLGSALGLVLLLLLFVWLRKILRKRKNKKHKEDLFKHLLLQQQTSEGTFGKTKLFTAKELEKATDNFNENRICGQGGQGIVYKGMLSDGTIVAIKKVKQVDEKQVEQFINEVVILSQINHKNVVKLLGCCLATEAPQLVYEFLPCGTLFDLIRDPKIEFPLTWNMRLKIAADIAGAVAYLHSASVPIYHRDIKSTNILLDEKYVIKVSYFGISKFVEVDQTHLTTLVKGTFGYLDPEYFQTSQYTEKSDVYSFGVVLLELLTGQQPISWERSEVERNLATHFLATMEKNNLDAILDTQVFEQGAKEVVTVVAKLARRCLNVKGRMRPTMKEVTTKLESLRMSQMPSTVIDEPEEEEAVSEAKNMIFSDVEYTWTINHHNMATSSSEAHPLMSE